MVKKTWILTFLILLDLMLLPACPAMAGSWSEKEAEWTVLFYMCGSDLESRYSYASGNLEEILRCTYPADLWKMYRDDRTDENGGNALNSDTWDPDKVNVVLQTGGSGEWHAQPFGMEISTERLQRWHFRNTTPDEYVLDNEFVLDDEQPLQSMADPGTLSDFIRWGAENYPAKKYALVLWGHGKAQDGIFDDELFDNDVMALGELHDALGDGGVDFETVLFDACMMGNLETAHAIRDNARWMVASEEVVAGEGTAVDDWLTQLYQMPRCDGKLLGRWMCDMSQIRYAEKNDEQNQELLTWSVIDLSKIERVEAVFDRFFEECGDCYVNAPSLIEIYTKAIERAEEFGSGLYNMFDLAGLFYGNSINGNMIEADLCHEMLDALADAVTYTVRGPGRSAARGLSFCWASNYDSEELDSFARCCPSAHYLALLDAINPGWEAPEWVYETAQRLPDIRELEPYQVQIEKKIAEDGTPGVAITGSRFNEQGIYADYYRLNEATGETVRLGSMMAYPVYNEDDDYEMDCIREPWNWPAVGGEICDAELLSADLLGYEILINIPVQINGENCILRCGYDDETRKYTIYGVWTGYDADTSAFDRNVQSLSQLAGQTFSLLYPVEGTEKSGKTRYELSPELTMYRVLEVEEQTLPAGTYYLDYWVKDMFMRRLPVGRVEMYWDGESISFPAGEAWAGEMTITTPQE